MKNVFIFFLGLLVLSCEDGTLAYKDLEWLVHNRPKNAIAFPDDTEGINTWYWLTDNPPSSLPDSVFINGYHRCDLIHYYESEDRIEFTRRNSTELEIEILDPSWSVEYQEK